MLCKEENYPKKSRDSIRLKLIRNQVMEIGITSTENIYKPFAVIYIRGLLAKGQPVDDVWSRKWGPPNISQLMSRNIYKDLIRYPRFDIRYSRNERLRSDKICPFFSGIWNRFIDNCKTSYIPNADITVGEQMIPTKSTCPIT